MQVREVEEGSKTNFAGFFMCGVADAVVVAVLLLLSFISVYSRYFISHHELIIQ